MLCWYVRIKDAELHILVAVSVGVHESLQDYWRRKLLALEWMDIEGVVSYNGKEPGRRDRNHTAACRQHHKRERVCGIHVRSQRRRINPHAPSLLGGWYCRMRIYEYS